MPAVESDAARLVGGSEADRSRLLERVHEYLEANASFDWGRLQDIWSGAPEAVFFNLNGHTYKGREHWTRLWQFYQPNVRSGYWTPFDLGGVLSDDLAIAMLMTLWPTGEEWPAQRETIVRLSGIARAEMVGALDRLRRGERAGRVLDDRFISGFALAGTAEEVIAQAALYRRAGADELALSFAGPQPAADAAYFARAVKRLTPDGL
jgi:hypothetical protein